MSVTINDGTISTRWKQYRVTARYTGEKPAPWMPENSHHHRMAVTNTNTRRRLTFDFWSSFGEPEIRTRRQLLIALACYLDDARRGGEDFEGFCANLGFDPENRESRAAWRACIKAKQRVERVFDEDIDDLLDELAEYRLDVLRLS